MDSLEFRYSGKQFRQKLEEKLRTKVSARDRIFLCVYDDPQLLKFSSEYQSNARLAVKIYK
jgi:hypothetical protein